MEGVGPVVFVGDREVDLVRDRVRVRVVLDPVGVPTDDLNSRDARRQPLREASIEDEQDAQARSLGGFCRD